ncbi:MAG: hypothetical protein Q7T72_04470 [Bacteroidales bacterium]|nr:hypothetical protein [Bacteroidales bacterium]
MEALYKLNAKEINASFIESVKKLFSDKDVIIRITSYADDTEYLSHYPANENHIQENMVADPVKRFSGNEFGDYSSKLL